MESTRQVQSFPTLEDMFGSELTEHEMETIRSPHGGKRAVASVTPKRKVVAIPPVSAIYSCAGKSTTTRKATAHRVNLGAQEVMRCAASRSESDGSDDNSEFEFQDSFVDRADASASSKDIQFCASGVDTVGVGMLHSIEGALASAPFDDVMPPRLPAGQMVLSSLSEIIRNATPAIAAAALGALAHTLARLGCVVS